MTVRVVVALDAADAVELGELLEFLAGWLDSDGDQLAQSFDRFVATSGYDLGALRADLSRFAGLVGGGGDELLSGGGEE
jgi:hypothetical protein